MRRTTSTVLIMALSALGLVVTPTIAAYADPPGCSKRLGNFGVTDSGELYASASGQCDKDANRTLNIEIKQDLDFRPDPVALKSADVGKKRYYSTSVSGCDNHNFARYYPRTFYSGQSDYLDRYSDPFQSC